MDFIESAQLGPGDTLPGERDLAERLGVSRATRAQAITAERTDLVSDAALLKQS